MIVVVANTMRQAEALCNAVGLEHLPDDERVEDWQSYPELVDEMQGQFEAVFATRTGLEWEEMLNAVSVPCGKVREIPEILAEPHVEARRAIQPVFVPSLNETIRAPGLGCVIGGENGRVRSAPPELSQHADEVLSEAGYSEEEITAMREKGITL